MDAEQNTPAWRLFHRLYRVGIKEMFFYPPEDVMVFGRPTSGNKRVDMQVMNSLRTVMIPGSTMAEYFSVGADVHFANPKNIVLVYDDIMQHLRQWESVILNNLHGNIDIPLDDLVKLDQFKDALYRASLAGPQRTRVVRYRKSNRTFGRGQAMREERFPDEVGQPTTEKEYATDGSHLLLDSPLLLDATDMSPKRITPADVDRLKNDYAQLAERDKLTNFTDIFEKYHAKKMLEEKRYARDPK